MTLLRYSLPCLYRTLLLIFVTALMAGRALSQVSSWPLDEPVFQASPAEILSAAGKITPEKYAQVTVLFEEDKNTLDLDGRVTNSHRLIYRIETKAGLDSWSESSVEWEAFYQ